jgi:hypothetical protein
MLQPVEEVTDLLPDLNSTGKAPPVGANQAYQLVTLVDWENIIFGSRKTPDVPNAVDQQSFNVGFHLLQQRIGFLDVFPGF